MFSQLQIYGAEKGLKNTNNAVFGYVHNTYVTLTLNNQTIITLDIPIKGVTNKTIKRMRKEWKKEVPHISMINTLQLSDSFQTSISAKQKHMSVDVIDYLITSTLRIIAEEGGILRSDCTTCKQETSDFAYDGTHIVPYCKDCQEKIGEVVISGDVSPISYLTGLVGALLGAMVSIIPYFVVIAVSNTMFSMLAFLVALGSVFGYKLFKGAKTTWFGIFSVLVSTVISTVMGYIFFIMISNEMAFEYFSMQMIRYIFTAVGLKDFGFTFLCSVLGVFYAYRSVKTYANPVTPTAISCEPTISQ